MPRLHLSFEKTRGTRQAQCRLGNVISWLGLDSAAELFPLRFRAVRTDQHSVAARFAHRFHHQLVQVFEHVASLRTVGE